MSLNMDYHTVITNHVYISGCDHPCVNGCNILIKNLIGQKNILQIDGGETHSIFLDQNGKVFTMGSNTFGQLGCDEYLVGQVYLNKLCGIIIKLVSGVYHSLALDYNGKIYTWGNNIYSPILVSGFINKSVQIAAGERHSMALDNMGNIFIWKADNYSKHYSKSIIQINDLLKSKTIMQIAAGQFHCLAVDCQSKVYSFHYTIIEKIKEIPTIIDDDDDYVVDGQILNLGGSLNYGISLNTSQFDQKNNFQSKREDIIKNSQTTKLEHQRGDYQANKKENSQTPKLKHQRGDYQVKGKDSLSADKDSQQCLNSRTRGETCKNNLITDYHISVYNFYPKRIIKISGGDSFSLALDSSGIVYAWGKNAFGQLGDGTYIDKSSPISIDNLSGKKITQIATGSAHSVALDSDGKVYTWGLNNCGQLCYNNSKIRVPYPVCINNNTKIFKIIQIAAGTYHTLLVQQDTPSI